MVLKELKPQDSPDYRPSLCIVRQVVDMPKNFNAGINREVKMHREIDRDDVKVLLRPESIITLISAEEVLNLYNAFGGEQTLDDLNDLTDHLEENLPGMLHEKISISARPLDVRHEMVPGDPELGERMINCANFRSPYNNRLDTERWLARKVICKFLDVDPLSQALRNIWASDVNSDIGRLSVARVIRQSNINNMGPLLSQTRALPLAINLAPAAVNEV